MVCKEDVCKWFKNLSPHKRIDYMCGMLDICLPLELRFVGSYVEDLAKKEFNTLRESEGKANSRHELSKYQETGGRMFRTKMAVYLALLHSSNRTCSNIIFDLLEKQVQESLTVIDSMDSFTVHNILLVLSMAMNHPAFSYYQKNRMYEYYMAANETAERILDRREPELVIATESCDFRSYDHGVSPMCSPHVSQMHLPSPDTMAQHQHSVHQEKVHVHGIDIRTFRQVREGDMKSQEYELEVTWSNGEKKTVCKTYRELCDFHKKLQQMFPEEMASHQQAIKPPLIKATNNHKKENRDLFSSYAGSLLDLPEHIRQNSVFTSFFEPPATHQPQVKMADACTSPCPHRLPEVPLVQHLTNSGEEETVIEHQYAGHSPTQTLFTSYLPHSPGNDMCSLSPHSPVHHELAYQSSAHSPYCSTKTTSPLISSPCHSPISSLESLANSQPGSPSMNDKEDTNHRTERSQGTRHHLPPETSLEIPAGIRLEDEDNGFRYQVGEEENGIRNVESTGSISKFEENEVTALLKLNNLSKFADAFLGLTLMEAANLSLESIEARCEAPRNTAVVIKQLVEQSLQNSCEKQPALLNGVIAPTVPPGVVWPAVPMYPQHLAPGMIPSVPFQHLGGYQHSFTPFTREDGSFTRVRDTSPTNSDSSPSGSPRLRPYGAVRKSHLPQTTDSSSDDGERDKRPGQQRGTKWKNHSAPNSARGSRQDKTVDISKDGNIYNETVAADKGDSNLNNAGHKGILGNGYTSDPTFTRHPMFKGFYKAQPAHTNIPVSHSSYFVNMPDNGFKGGAQAFGPMILPQHMRQEITMTTNSGHYGFGVSPSELGYRPLFYSPNAPPSMLTRSHVNPVVAGTRPVFPAGVVTTSSAVVIPTVHPPVSGSGAAGKVIPAAPPAPVVPSVPIAAGTLPTTQSGIINSIDSQVITSVPQAESCAVRSQIPPTPVVNSLTSASVTQTRTSSSPSLSANGPGSCSSCSCHNQMVQPSFSVVPNMQPHVWQGSYYSGLLQMQVPPVNYPYFVPNGFNQEFLYNPQVYGIPHSQPQTVPQNVIYNGYSGYNSNAVQPGSYSQKKPKKLNCHNCGSSKHLAADCTESSMDAMSGPNLMNYEPSQSDHDRNLAT